MKKMNLYQLTNVSFGKINGENCFMCKLGTGSYIKVGSNEKYNIYSDKIIEYKSLKGIIKDHKLDYLLLSKDGVRNLITYEYIQYVKYFSDKRNKIKSRLQQLDFQSLKVANAIVRKTFADYSVVAIKATTKQKIAVNLASYISLRILEDKEFYIFKDETKFEDGFYNALINNKIKNLPELADFCVMIENYNNNISIKDIQIEKVLQLQEIA